jgi:hypothetical protein
MNAPSYIAALRYSEFISWYRTGSISLARERLFEVQTTARGSFEPVIASVDMFVRSTPAYEDDWEVLICQVSGFAVDARVTEADHEPFVDIHFEQVAALYPISERGKALLQNRLDRDIILQNPLLPNEFARLDEERHFAIARRGGDAVLRYFRLEKQKSESKQLLQAVREGLKLRDSSVPHDEAGDCFVRALLCYDRHNPRFPRTSIGYLYDIGILIGQSFSDSDVDRRPLEALREVVARYREQGSTDVWEVLDDNLTAILDALGDVVHSRVSLVSAIVFLQVQDVVRNDSSGNALSQIEPLVDQIRQAVQDDTLSEGLWLAGAWFGFPAFASEYYRRIKIPVYGDGECEEDQLVGIHVPPSDMEGYEEEDESVFTGAVPYQSIHLSLGDLEATSLKDAPLDRLAKMVVEVVKSESPLQWEEVVVAITSAFGSQRTSKQMRKRLDGALQQVLASGEAERRGEFLYKSGQTVYSPRDRSLLDGRYSLDQVAPEEIEAAVSVARGDGLIMPDEIIQRVEGLLGVSGSRKARVSLKESLTAGQAISDSVSREKHQQELSFDSDQTVASPDAPR